MARKRIDKLRLDFVSLCDLGDNGPAEVVIHKTRTASVDNLNEDDHADTTWGMPNQQPPARPSADALQGLPDDVAKYLLSLEDTVLRQEDVIEKMNGSDDSGDSSDEKDEESMEDEDLEKVLKSLPAPAANLIRKQHEALQATNARLEEAEKIAKAERETRLVREFEARAASEFSHLGRPSDVGAVLKSASESLGDEAFTGLVAILKRADAGMSELFVEVGHATPGEPLNRFDAAVAKARTDNPGISEADAIAKAAEMDPKAYDAWNADFMRGAAR